MRENDQSITYTMTTNAKPRIQINHNAQIAIETLQITGDAERKGAATAAGLASGGQQRAISVYYGLFPHNP